MFSARPITSRIASRLSGDSVAAAAERTISLWADQSSEVELPIILPGEAERIIGHQGAGHPQLNLERLTKRVVRQGATRMHLLRDVIVADGCVMTRSYFQRVRQVRRRLFVKGEPERLDEAALCSSYLTEKYFGHWVCEGLALEQLAVDQGLLPVVLDHPLWFHEAAYRKLLSMQARQVKLAWFDRLWLLEDVHFNSHFAQRYRRIRATLRKEIGAPERPNGRVFIPRGKGGRGRALVNQDKVQGALSALGFVTVDTDELEALEIARALSGARIIVAPEGSALGHAVIAMPEGAALLTILGAQHFNMNYKGVSDALGFTFGFTIADAVDRDRYSQPIDRLLQTIDLVEAAADARLGARATPH